MKLTKEETLLLQISVAEYLATIRRRIVMMDDEPAARDLERKMVDQLSALLRRLENDRDTDVHAG